MMKTNWTIGMWIGALGFLAGCAGTPGSFGHDRRFLQRHVDTVVLSDSTGRKKVIVAPCYQGRVMTSTAGGDAGMSYGWINHDLIRSGKVNPKFNAFGGEERLWLAPEGGQYALFFPPGKPFDIGNWQTPAVLDTEPFEILSRDASSITVGKSTKITNHRKAVFDVRLERRVRVMEDSEIQRTLGLDEGKELRCVAYESTNTLKNAGKLPWSREDGLLAIWMLGQYKPSDKVTVVIPLRQGRTKDGNPKYEDSYFGRIEKDRIDSEDSYILFRGDGKSRGKIGVPARWAKDILGSYDAENQLLTIVTFGKPADGEAYVKNTWGVQDNPYDGEVVMSYNDGPLGGGLKQLGPFYELETASPARELKGNQSLTHIQRTYHFQGDVMALDAASRRLLGVPLDKVAEFVGK